MRNLYNLRLLGVYVCPNLKTIAPGVIADLSLLEELKVRGSFCQWEGERGENSTNASLTELQSLSRLKNLEIEIQDSALAGKDIQSFPCLQRFCIQIGTTSKDCSFLEEPMPYKTGEGERYMHLSLPMGIYPGNWILDLLRATEYLSLSGNGSIELIFHELNGVKNIRIQNAPLMSCVWNYSSIDVYRTLESLDLNDLPDLREVVCTNGPIQDGSFNNILDLKLCQMPALYQLCLWNESDQTLGFLNLRSVYVHSCKIQRKLFTLSLARRFLVPEEMKILFCGTMEEVISPGLDEVGTSTISFPRLNKLVLFSLPKLTAFCRGVERIEFPQLSSLTIKNVPMCQGFLPTDNTMPVFLNPKIEFGCLKELRLQGLADNISQIWSLRPPNSHFNDLEKIHICSCNKLRNLCSPSVARGLWRLKELNIGDILMMTQVILNEERQTEGLIFPRLERLELWELRSLGSFCQWKCSLEFPSLKQVIITRCHEMRSFTLGSVSTPKLKDFRIDDESIGTKGLNGAIRRYHRAKNTREESTSSVLTQIGGLGNRR